MAQVKSVTINEAGSPLVFINKKRVYKIRSYPVNPYISGGDDRIRTGE